MELGCAWHRFDVDPLDVAQRPMSWVVSQDVKKQPRGMSFHRSLLCYRLQSQPWGNWCSPLGTFKYGLVQCRLYYNTN